MIWPEQRKDIFLEKTTENNSKNLESLAEFEQWIVFGVEIQVEINKSIKILEMR